MPLYEYECKNCRNRVERIQKVTDPPLQICSRCNGSLKRLISTSNICFKGSGWYVTDYAKNKSDNSLSEQTADKEKGGNKEIKQSSNNDSSAHRYTSPDKSSLP